jgi:formate dehydrogenase major subunit
VEGRIAHQVGIPIHWAYSGETVGDSANDLTSLITDPNVSMHEAKAFACELRPGRLNRNRHKVPFAPLPIAEPTPETPQSAQPEGRQRT